MLMYYLILFFSGEPAVIATLTAMSNPKKNPLQERIYNYLNSILFKLLPLPDRNQMLW